VYISIPPFDGCASCIDRQKEREKEGQIERKKDYASRDHPWWHVLREGYAPATTPSTTITGARTLATESLEPFLAPFHPIFLAFLSAILYMLIKS